MSCVIGLIHDGITWIGGDSAGVGADTTFRGKTQKVFRKGPYVIGFAGSYSVAQSIRGLELPQPKGTLTPLGISEFMEVEFSGFLKDQVYSNAEDASLLVGIEGQLFEVDASYGVFEAELPFNAIGGAADFALGALGLLTSWFDPGVSPETWIPEALRIAHEFSPGSCQPPFLVLHT